MRKMEHQYVQRAEKSAAITTRTNKCEEKCHSAVNKSKNFEVLLVAREKYAYTSDFEKVSSLFVSFLT